MNNIVRIRFGSHLYGTATPQSDEDWKSAHIPAARDILLQRAKEAVGAKVKPQEGIRNLPTDVDDESYALHRYLQLLAEGQTVAIDMLFAPPSHCEFGPNYKVWSEILFNKERLLTKRSAAFVGYCRTQANKYGIKGSRVAAAKHAMEFFEHARGIFGDQAKLDYVQDDLRVMMGSEPNEHTAIVQGGKEDRPETFFECCNRKVSFGNTVKAAHEVYRTIYEKYGERARMAESAEGIDWKALSHAVRVGEEALELLHTGCITFPLKNAREILDIKLGNLKYDHVARRIEYLLERVEEASKVSILRDDADHEFIDDLVADAYKEEVLR